MSHLNKSVSPSHKRIDLMKMNLARLDAMHGEIDVKLPKKKKKQEAPTPHLNTL
jgi:hypothetical protein